MGVSCEESLGIVVGVNVHLEYKQAMKYGYLINQRRPKQDNDSP